MSRLLEMQALEYVKASQASFPQGASWIKRTSDTIAAASGEQRLLDQLRAGETGPGSIVESLLLQAWKQYRVGSIDENNFPTRPAPGEAGEAVRLEDVAVFLADLAEFAVGLRPDLQAREAGGAGGTIVRKILPDRLEELFNHGAADDWGNRFVYFGDFTAVAKELLLHAARTSS